jgi:hypothetical protein
MPTFPDRKPLLGLSLVDLEDYTTVSNRIEDVNKDLARVLWGNFDAGSVLGRECLVPDNSPLPFIIEEEPEVGRVAESIELNVGECAVRAASRVVADWSAIDVADKEVHNSMGGELKSLRCESGTMLSGDGLLTYELAYIPPLDHNDPVQIAISNVTNGVRVPLRSMHNAVDYTTHIFRSRDGSTIDVVDPSYVTGGPVVGYDGHPTVDFNTKESVIG